MTAPPEEAIRVTEERRNAGHAEGAESLDGSGFDRLVWRFGTRGISLSWLPSGELVAYQGSWCRLLSDIEAAARFARVVGV